MILICFFDASLDLFFWIIFYLIWDGFFGALK